MSRGQTPLLCAAVKLYHILVVVGSPPALRLRQRVLGQQTMQQGLRQQANRDIFLAGDLRQDREEEICVLYTARPVFFLALATLSRGVQYVRAVAAVLAQEGLRRLVQGRRL